MPTGHTRSPAPRSRRPSGAPDKNMSLSNPNADWLNLRGTWVTNVLLVVALKVLFTCVPRITPEMSWTLTNLTYNICAFFFFHWLCGTPFDTNQGEYGALTLWEQLDEGEQYAPARKFLLAFPVFLFLISTHYTQYDLKTFCANLAVLTVTLVAKLPAMHTVRIFGINKKPS